MFAAIWQFMWRGVAWLLRELWVWHAYLLTLFVLGLLCVASVTPERWQVYILLLAALAWVVLVFHVKFPDGQTASAYKSAMSFLVNRRERVACVPVVVAAVLVIFRSPVLKWGGDSWTGVVFKVSVVLLAAALTIVPFRWFVSEASTAGLVFSKVLGSLAFLLWPVFALETIDWFRRLVGDRPSVLWAVAWVMAGTLAALVGFPLVRLIARLLNVVRGPGKPANRALASAVQAAAPTRVRRLRGTLGALGIVLALASSALALVASFGVLIERRTLETSEIAQPGSRDVVPCAVLQYVRGGKALSSVPANISAARKLAKCYRPVLRMRKGDWTATSASTWLEGSTEVCDADKSRCKRTYGADSEQHAWPRAPARGTIGGDGAVVYAHVVQVPGYVAASGAAAANAGNPQTQDIRKRTAFVIEYWLFYPYDRWESSSAVGDFAQVHEGDWEMVAVGLDEQSRPLLVAYSAHCGGTWRPWTEAPVVALDDTGSGPPQILVGAAPAAARHPVSVVADGSHANYPSAGEREPDWAGCELNHSASNALRLLSFAASIKERTDAFGAVEVPDVAPSAEAQAVFAAPDPWGLSGATTLGGFEVTTDATGPEGLMDAKRRKIWLRPLDAFFDVGAHWSRDTRGEQTTA